MRPARSRLVLAWFREIDFAFRLFDLLFFDLNLRQVSGLELFEAFFLAAQILCLQRIAHPSRESRPNAEQTIPLPSLPLALGYAHRVMTAAAWRLNDPRRGGHERKRHCTVSGSFITIERMKAKRRKPSSSQTDQRTIQGGGSCGSISDSMSIDPRCPGVLIVWN
jgi:hypothetical protein